MHLWHLELEDFIAHRGSGGVFGVSGGASGGGGRWEGLCRGLRGMAPVGDSLGGGPVEGPWGGAVAWSRLCRGASRDFLFASV